MKMAQSKEIKKKDERKEKLRLMKVWSRHLEGRRLQDEW